MALRISFRTLAKHSIVLSLAIFAFLSPAYSDGWLTDWEAAMKAAKANRRPILIYFTGSDWCPSCKRLKAEVLGTKEFKEWAQKSVVLLELDYPKSQFQEPGLRRQNTYLRDKFMIQGYPTVIFVNSQGDAIGKTGYIEGGPANWIEKADELLTTKR